MTSFEARVPRAPHNPLRDIVYLYEAGLYFSVKTGQMLRFCPQYLAATCVSLLICSPAPVRGNNLSSTQSAATSSSLTHAKQRLSELDAELSRLAPLSMRSGIGATGYRSQSYAESNNAAWIEVRWDKNVVIDEIVLVPTIWRNLNGGYSADGFPIEFHVLIGSDKSSDGVDIASYTAEDSLLPRVAPLVIHHSGSEAASWIRVVATSLSPRIWDGRYDLQLSEIMVFAGPENVALHADVKVSSSAYEETLNLDPRFLVDGHLPYLMASTVGTKSMAYISPTGISDQPNLTIDLGKSFDVNGVSLFAPDVSDTVPQNRADDFAIPKRMEISGSSSSDFSDAKPLCEIQVKSIYDSGPMLMRRFPKQRCRYVRVSASQPFTKDGTGNGNLIGFAEIEVYSDGRNVAINRPVVADLDAPKKGGRSLSLLTDGRNFYGEILPIRDWMNQLARRHELQRERPMVISEVNAFYTRQSTMLRLVTFLAAILTVLIGCILLISKMIRQRDLKAVKERFAADLHDELGANLHTIGLLSDLATQAQQTPGGLRDESLTESATETAGYLQRIRALTDRTGISVRHFFDIHDGDDLYKNFLPNLKQAAERTVVNLDHEITVEGEKFIEKLSPRARVDLLLFYKECLVNISRHSGATQLATTLIGTAQSIQLTVSDNGRGLSESSFGTVPPSLKRRSRLMGASVHLEAPDDCGVQIHLELSTRHWGIQKWRFFK